MPSALPNPPEVPTPLEGAASHGAAAGGRAFAMHLKSFITHLVGLMPPSAHLCRATSDDDKDSMGSFSLQA
jgi:hypothetical protein